MNYQDYKDARDASRRILIDCEATELPVRIIGVCRVLGVSVRRYTPAERGSNDGMSTELHCIAWHIFWHSIYTGSCLKKITKSVQHPAHFQHEAEKM